MKMSIIIGTCLLFIFIILYFQKIKFKRRLRNKVLQDGTSDYKGVAENIALSIAKSRNLYKELIIKVHPDRFLDSKKEIATELSSRITKAKKNYSELLHLKEEVENFLNNNK